METKTDDKLITGISLKFTDDKQSEMFTTSLTNWQKENIGGQREFVLSLIEQSKAFVEAQQTQRKITALGIDQVMVAQENAKRSLENLTGIIIETVAASKSRAEEAVQARLESLEESASFARKKCKELEEENEKLKEADAKLRKLLFEHGTTLAHNEALRNERNDVLNRLKEYENTFETQRTELNRSKHENISLKEAALEHTAKMQEAQKTYDALYLQYNTVQERNKAQAETIEKYRIQHETAKEQIENLKSEKVDLATQLKIANKEIASNTELARQLEAAKIEIATAKANVEKEQATAKANVEIVQANVNALKEEIERLKAGLATATTENKAFQDQNKKLESELAAKQATVVQLKENMADLKANHTATIDALTKSKTEKKVETETKPDQPEPKKQS